jgi:MAE_28990/MAE_18760-like HEPN
VFAQVHADFNDRVREVNSYFDLLRSLDNDEVAILAGTTGQVTPLGKPPAEWRSLLKGAAHLILYNLVEAFVRRGFQEVFEAIRADGLCGADLIEAVRTQWIEQRNRKVSAFDGAPKVYMGIAGDIIKEVIAKQAAEMTHDRLPITGNIDADVVRQVCRDHGVTLTIPPGAKGGAALKNVKTKRNTLAHGQESFIEVGRSATVADLVLAKNEIVMFMQSVLNNLESYATSKSYKL